MDMDMDRNSTHDTHPNARPNPSLNVDPRDTTTPSTSDYNLNPNTSPSTSNPTSSTHLTSTPTSNTTNIPQLTVSTNISHLTPNPAKGALKAMFRSSIEPVDASGEWLPAVAILGQSSSAGSGSTGVSASAKGNKNQEVRDARGETTHTPRGPQVELATQAHPQASTSGPSATAPMPAESTRPPMLPSMARIRPSSLDLSDGYPPDVDDEGDGPTSSDPLNSSFSVVGRNPRYSMTSNARYSLISSPPETPLDSTGFTVPAGPLPPRFMNMGGGGDANFGPSAFGGASGISGSGVDVQPPPPSWMTGSTGYPVHVPVQLQDNGASNSPGSTATPWHSYHTPRDTEQVRNFHDTGARPAAAPASAPQLAQPSESAPVNPLERSDIPHSQTQAPGQPWSYPAFQQGGPPFSRGPDLGAPYYDPWASTRPRGPWSAPAPYTPWRPPTMSSAQTLPQLARPQSFSTSAPIAGVRFASEYVTPKESELDLIPPGYEANDPFKRHTKPVQPTDDLTFDDIPVPGKQGVSQSWQNYEGSAARPQQQQQPSSANPIQNAHVPFEFPMGSSTSRPSQSQQVSGSNPTPWSQPHMGSAPPQPQQPPAQQQLPPFVEPPRPGPLSGSGSGSGPYLPLHSNNGSYQSYPYYPPPISPAYAWPKPPPLWRRILNPFKRARKDYGDTQYDVLLPPFNGTGITTASSSTWSPATTAIRFVFLTIPSQLYLYLLLRLPSLYFSRVARIFEEADLTLSELKKMALEIGSEGASAGSRRTDRDFAAQMHMHMELLDGVNVQGMGGASKVPIVYERLKTTWEAFIDSVLREWKTFNIISVLLLSAILTILQIEEAAADPVTRYTALYSLVCALISLLFGCVYIIRFGTMRKAYKAAEWALEAKKSKTLIWWNVWILLAMPAIWLSWSLILYVACILSFVWRTGDPVSGPPSPLSPRGILAVRIVLTIVLGLGAIYGSLIFSTFRRYGEAMDKKWKARIDGWTREKANELYSRPYPQSQPYSNPSPYYYPSFVSAPYDPSVKIPVTGSGPGASWYTPSQRPSHPRSASHPTPAGNEGWESQTRQQQARSSPPIPTARGLNGGPPHYPPTQQPPVNEQKLRQSSMDEEVPRYSYPDFKSSWPTSGYTADTKAQYDYESIGNTDDRDTKPGQMSLPRTQNLVSNPSQPVVDKTGNIASSSTLTITQVPPYSSPSTSPTPPSYSSIPAYVTTHNMNTNPIRFNTPVKKNPQVSMPPPPSLPTIPGTPLTIASMRSFDSTAGAENFPVRGSPGNDSMSASTSISNLQIDHSPSASTVIGGLSPRAASKRPAGADDNIDPSTSGVSSRSRSMSPQTPLLPSNMSSVHVRSLSDHSVGMDRSSHGSSRLGLERLPPGAAPPMRTSGEAFDAS